MIVTVFDNKWLLDECAKSITAKIFLRKYDKEFFNHSH